MKQAVFAAVMAAGFVFSNLIKGGEVPFKIPVMKKAPKIDGKIDPKEWKTSHSFFGFQRKVKINRKKVIAYIGAIEDTLFVAIKSQLPDKGKLKVGEKNKPGKVVHDDAVEVFVNPAPEARDRGTYQMLSNGGAE